jgi:hypothetical protein
LVRTIEDILEIGPIGLTDGLAVPMADARRTSSEPPRMDIATPLDIVVEAIPEISHAVVKGTLEEAAAIWDPAGVALRWHVVDPLREPADPGSVRVILNDDVGAAYYTQRALGWITFGDSAPEPVIHLSHGTRFADEPGQAAPDARTGDAAGTGTGPRAGSRTGSLSAPVGDPHARRVDARASITGRLFRAAAHRLRASPQERGLLAVRVGLQAAD